MQRLLRRSSVRCHDRDIRPKSALDSSKVLGAAHVRKLQFQQVQMRPRGHKGRPKLAGYDTVSWVSRVACLVGGTAVFNFFPSRRLMRARQRPGSRSYGSIRYPLYSLIGDTYCASSSPIGRVFHYAQNTYAPVFDPQPPASRGSAVPAEICQKAEPATDRLLPSPIGRCLAGRKVAAKSYAMGLAISCPDDAYSLDPSNHQPTKPYGVSVSGRLRDPWKTDSAWRVLLELRSEQRLPPRAGLGPCAHSADR